MTGRVLVLTKNPYLGQKIALELAGKCDVKVESSVPEDVSPFGTVFLDRDTVSAVIPSAVVLSSDGGSANGGCANGGASDGDSADGGFVRDLPLPLPFGLVEKYITSEGEEGKLLLLHEKRCVMFRERTVKLTDAEYLLLSRLMSARGGFVSREELLSHTFSEDATGSALNVYIHYLREKLEFSGEKIILSSRKAGYAIDRKYIGG